LGYWRNLADLKPFACLILVKLIPCRPLFLLWICKKR